MSSKHSSNGASRIETVNRAAAVARGDTPDTGSAVAGRAAAGKGVYRNVRHFSHDLVHLAELQAKLLFLDLKDWKGHALKPAIGLGVALVVLLATLPVALLAGGQALVDFAGWPATAGYGLAAGVGFVVAALLLVICGKQLAGSFASLRRSRQEFVKNLEWLKTVLSEGGGVAPRGASFPRPR